MSKASPAPSPDLLFMIGLNIRLRKPCPRDSVSGLIWGIPRCV